MTSLIIQSENTDNLELLAQLAKKLGVQVKSVSEEQTEDLALGTVMTSVKTGKSVSRDVIMKKLRK